MKRANAAFAIAISLLLTGCANSSVTVSSPSASPAPSSATAASSIAGGLWSDGKCSGKLQSASINTSSNGLLELQGRGPTEGDFFAFTTMIFDESGDNGYVLQISDVSGDTTISAQDAGTAKVERFTNSYMLSDGVASWRYPLSSFPKLTSLPLKWTTTVSTEGKDVGSCKGTLSE